jgi:hypothetical protein
VCVCVWLGVTIFLSFLFLILSSSVVRLLDSTGATLFTTKTDARGLYQINSFDYDIVPGTSYFVAILLTQSEITGPQLTPTTALVGANRTVDSNGVVSGGDVRAAVSVPSYGTTDNSIDFGFVPPAPKGITIGNFLWNDDNNNGLQDGGEDGIPGVSVRLCVPSTPCTAGAGLVATTTTTPSGIYLFNNQVPVMNAFAPNTPYVIQITANTGPIQVMSGARARAFHSFQFISIPIPYSI